MIETCDDGTRNGGAIARWLILLMLSGWVAGCATPAATGNAAVPREWSERQQQLLAITDWALDGRVAVDDGSEGWQASVNWRQQPERYRIDLIGPLGQGRAAVVGQRGQVTLDTGTEVLRAADPDDLLQQAMGVNLPISGLRYWIRGLPDPAQPARPRFDDRARLVRLEQNGWVIEYPNYIEVGDMDLPKRIRASQGDVKVKLVVSTWTP